MLPRHLRPTASIDAELANRLLNDDAFRRRYIRFWAQNEVASEIRALRKARKLRQGDVAALADTGQSAISRIEKAAYDGWTFKTLISIAEVLKARLRITFEPIEAVAMGHRASSQTVAAEHFEHATDTAASDAVDIATEGVTLARMTRVVTHGGGHVQLISGDSSASGMVM